VPGAQLDLFSFTPGISHLRISPTLSPALKFHKGSGPMEPGKPVGSWGCWGWGGAVGDMRHSKILSLGNPRNTGPMRVAS
jgi:hypothetical protein